LSTIAVDDSATRKPVKIAGPRATPAAASNAAVSATAPATCRPPPSSTSRRIRLSRWSENSMPMVNSSSITPISAAASMTPCSVTRARAFGPMTTPASRNPTIGTIRRRTKT